VEWFEDLIMAWQMARIDHTHSLSFVQLEALAARTDNAHTFFYSFTPTRLAMT